MYCTAADYFPLTACSTGFYSLHNKVSGHAVGIYVSHTLAKVHVCLPGDETSWIAFSLTSFIYPENSPRAGVIKLEQT